MRISIFLCTMQSKFHLEALEINAYDFFFFCLVKHLNIITLKIYWCEITIA